MAPVEPNWTETAVAPVSGHVYYIKCVDDGKYLKNPEPNYYIYTSNNLEDAGGYVFSKSSSGWSMMSAANAEYLNGNSSYLYHDITLGSNCYWKFDDELSADGHLVMMAEGQSNYSETNKYWYTSSSNIHVNGSSSSAKRFVFIDADVRERYLASKKLYDAIMVAKNRNLYVPNYETFYNERDNHTVAEIYAEANELIAATTTTKEEIILSDNEYPFILTATQGDWNRMPQHLGIRLSEGETASIKASFSVDKPSTFAYTIDMTTSETYIEKVYVDGELVSTIDNSYDINGNHYEKLGAGEHTIEWVFTKTRESGYYLYFRNLALMSSPLITVNLLEPGSLGTEALRNVDGLKDVKALKVIGRMNDDDWRYLSMMNHLLTVDLSEAVFTEIPEYGMSRQNSKFGFLHKVVLPEGVTKIGDYAFYNTYLEEVNVPSTVETIGESAFGHINIADIVLPNSVLTMGRSCFSDCYRLKHAIISNQIKEIPNYAFANCYQLTNNPMHEGITRIGDYAFRGCQSLCTASNGELIVPSKVTFIGQYAFYNCDAVTSVELPTTIYTLRFYFDNHPMFSNCDNINKIILRSPTLVTHKEQNRSYDLGCDLSKVDLIVPDYLVSNYKLDDYWYNYKTISGFSTADIQDWTINNPLVLNHDRFGGTPIIRINGNKDRYPSLKLNGDGAMTISDLYFNTDYYSNWNYSGQIISNCNDIRINGNVQVELYTEAKKWYFFSLPFDIKVSEITHSADGVQKAVRYYDGAGRAESGIGGNWKDYDADAVITAGTGFIMQTNADTYNYFHALDNANKQLSVSNAEIVKTLEVNDSEVASNKGWNLVGNPWQCWYNNHNLNFTAPFTVWSPGNRTYSAYSITDDDYAISPNEAFFVQCPSAEFNTIGFPVGGRQLTDVIETQNAAKPMNAQQSVRKLVNVVVTDGETEDKARVVLNENASLGYETICDAAKMMSMDANVPQIFTLDNDFTEYAINERPVADGVVKVGFYAGHDGEYTIRLGRCDAERVYLTDNENGETVELTDNGYSFSANAGVDNGRFTLRFNAGETTGIFSVENNEQVATERAYNIAGQRISRDSKGIVIVNGKKIVNK